MTRARTRLAGLLFVALGVAWIAYTTSTSQGRMMYGVGMIVAGLVAAIRPPDQDGGQASQAARREGRRAQRSLNVTMSSFAAVVGVLVLLVGDGDRLVALALIVGGLGVVAWELSRRGREP